MNPLNEAANSLAITGCASGMSPLLALETLEGSSPNVTAQACVRLALACNEELTIVARNAFT
ncbi:MAG: hypothetical protein K6U78_14535, partial [Anaerolineae bacterium]|nr:hypothetical protein [Anaerolineae bacterium]